MPSPSAPVRDDPVLVPGFVRCRLPDRVPPDAVFALLFVDAGLFAGVASLLRLSVGRATVHPDVRLVWRPLARAVAGGTPLYTAGATDNKPSGVPGWCDGGWPGQGRGGRRTSGSRSWSR